MGGAASFHMNLKLKNGRSVHRVRAIDLCFERRDNVENLHLLARTQRVNVDVVEVERS